MGKVSCKMCEAEKTVTDHRNNTKLQSEKNAKQNHLRNNTTHAYIMQTYLLAKVNLTQLSNVKFYCGLSNYHHFQRRSFIV